MAAPPSSCAAAGGSTLASAVQRSRLIVCDWRVLNGTRDAHICESRRIPVGDDKDLCPKHAKEWETHPANLQTVLPYKPREWVRRGKIRAVLKGKKRGAGR